MRLLARVPRPLHDRGYPPGRSLHAARLPDGRRAGGGGLSETEQETKDPVEDPTESPETTSDDETGEDTPDEQEQAQEPAEDPGDAQPEARDDHEIDAVYTKLATKAKNYAKGVSELDGLSGIPLAVCELCSDAYPGFRWQEPRTDAAAAALNAFGGMLDLDTLEDADWTDRCSHCAGKGVVKTKGLVNGNIVIECKYCNASGYVVLDQDTGIMKPPAHEQGTHPAAIAGVNPDDPRTIAEAIANGFVVIPPMAPVVPVS